MTDNQFNNRRLGMVLFRCWVSPDELQIILTSQNGEQVIKTIEEVRNRGDIV
jgi:hypothetical protein